IPLAEARRARVARRVPARAGVSLPPAHDGAYGAGHGLDSAAATGHRGDRPGTRRPTGGGGCHPVPLDRPERVRARHGSRGYARGAGCHPDRPASSRRGLRRRVCNRRGLVRARRSCQLRGRRVRALRGAVPHRLRRDPARRGLPGRAGFRRSRRAPTVHCPVHPGPPRAVATLPAQPLTDPQETDPMIRFLKYAILVAYLACAPAAGAQEPTGFTWTNATELSFVSTSGNASSSTLGVKGTLEAAGGANKLLFEGGAVRASSNITTRRAVGTAEDFTILEAVRSETTAESYFARSRYDRDLGGGFAFGGVGW